MKVYSDCINDEQVKPTGSCGGSGYIIRSLRAVKLHWPHLDIVVLFNLWESEAGAFVVVSFLSSVISASGSVRYNAEIPSVG